MAVELYYNPWCSACGGKEAVPGEFATVRWVDATRHLETAASLCITRLPALVVDGKLVAQGPRALERLRAWTVTGGNVR